MIPSINRYKLDTDVSSYGESLTPFGQGGYEWAEMFGRVPQFRGEEYYWVEDRLFLGRECKQAMLAAMNGKIYKISFRYHDSETDACVSVRKKAYDFFKNSLGEQTEFNEIAPDHKIILWQTDSGNAILELDDFDTELILTSNSVKSAKKISSWKRLFDRKKA